MQRKAIMASGRLAGMVTRYHTWPVHRAQSVAEHLWQQARIYFELWGPLPPQVSTYILWSDAGELWSGDMPFPVKLNYPELRPIADKIEGDALAAMGGVKPELSEIERVQVKVCDLLEMWEFGFVEFSMGNRFAAPVVEDTLAAALELAKQLPPELSKPIKGYTVRVMRSLS